MKQKNRNKEVAYFGNSIAGGWGKGGAISLLTKRRGFSGKTGIRELMNILDVQWLYISNGYQNIFLLNNFLKVQRVTVCS